MQKLTLSLFLLLISASITRAQSCDDPLCQIILNLRLENQKKNYEIYQRNIKIKDLTAQYGKLSIAEKNAKNEGRKLMIQINQLNEEKRKLELEKKDVEEKYVITIEELKKQKELTEAQKEIIATYEKEIRKVKAANWDLERQNDVLIRETKEIGFENSYFFNVELGYKKKESSYFSKVIKNGDETPVDTRGIFGSDKLNILRISGQTYIPIDKSTRMNNLKGKLLLYSDNRLVESIDYQFQETNTKTFFNHFEIINKEFDLKNYFPEKTNLKVAFIDNNAYEKNGKDAFDDFWIAQNQGLFTITSLKPQNMTEAATLEDILESSLIIGIPIHTNNNKLRIQMYDNGEVDGDRASFYVNKNKIIDDLLLRSEVYKEEILLEKGLNKFTLLALNNGSEPPCTVTVEVYDGERFLDRILLKAEVGSAVSIQIIVD